MEVPSYVGYIAAWAGLMGIIWVLFERTEKVLAKDTLKAISSWLKGITPPDGLKWPNQFAKLFDRVFTEHHWSWKCFLRSTIASFALVWIFSILYYSLWVDEVVEGWGLESLPDGMLLPMALGASVLLGVILNLLPDFLSLLETRWVLGRMASGRNTIWWLAFDLAATLTVAFVAMGVFTFINRWIECPTELRAPVLLVETAKVFAEALTVGRMDISDEQGLLSVFLYSTLFTSVWLWLYVLSGWVLRVRKVSAGAMQWFAKVFNVEEKPLTSMGYIASILVTVALAAFAAAVKLTS